MQNADSQKVVARFFEALYRLKADRVLRGKQTFTTRYGINRWNMFSLEHNHASDVFQPGWLTYLVDDYDVSPLWLLTGRGNFYQRGKVPTPKEKFTNARKEKEPAVIYEPPIFEEF